MSLSDICKDFNSKKQPSSEQHVDILSFCKDIIQVNPTPVQRFILKCFYGLKLDKKTKDILIPNHFNEKILYKFTEYDYWKYLRENERISLKDPEKLPEMNYWTLILPIGRRGGKTFLSAVISSYEVYRLLSIYDPYKFFEIDESSEIGITTVATARKQASLLYGMTTNFILRGSVFSNHRVSETVNDIKLESDYDIERYGKGKRPSIKITFNSCISRTLRGPGNIVGIMDECCHYITESASASSDRSVYNALDPSIASFNKDGVMYGKMIMISSPLNKSGIMYEKYKESIQNGDDMGVLMIQASSWEVNPKNVPSHYLKAKFKEKGGKENYWREFGARFSDKMSGWIEDHSYLNSVVIPDLIPRSRGIPGVPSFLGIDLGLSANGTALSVTSVNQNSEIELFYIDANYSTHAVVDPMYEPYVTKADVLEFEAIADWIEDIVNLYNVTDGVFDQFNGEPLRQILAKKKITCLRMVNFSRDLKSKYYNNFKLMMLDKKLRLFNTGEIVDQKTGEQEDCVYLKELKRLQKKSYSNNLVVVSKSEVTGHQDDFSDALVRSVWVATENLEKASRIASSIHHRRFKAPNYEHLARQYMLKRRMYPSKRPVFGTSRRRR